MALSIVYMHLRSGASLFVKPFPVILLDIRGFGVLLRGEGWAERLLGIGKGVGEEEDTKIFIYFWKGKIIFK